MDLIQCNACASLALHIALGTVPPSYRSFDFIASIACHRVHCLSRASRRLHSNLTGAQIESSLSEQGAVNVEVDMKGVQRMAYPITGFWEGFMFFMKV